MKKLLFCTICIIFCTTFISGCTTTVRVPVTPCCRNPYHDHYIAPPMLLWTERVTTDSYSRKIEERFWIPTK